MLRKKTKVLKQDHTSGSPRNTSFGLYIFSSIATLLVITVVIIVGYIWYQYSKALTEISSDQMNQATAMVREKVLNYLKPAAVMAKLSSQILKEGGFDQRSAVSGRKSGRTSPNLSLPPLKVLEQEPAPALKKPRSAPPPDIQSNAPAPGQNGILSLVDSDILEAYGIHVLRSFPQVAMINIADEQGNFMMPKKFPDGKIGTKIIDRAANPPTVTWKYRNETDVVDKVETSEDVKYDPRTRPWYRGAKDSESNYWTNVYIFFSDQTPGITTSYPLNSADGDFAGVLSLDLALSEISTFLRQLKIGKTGIAYIINKKNEVIAYPDPASMVKKEGGKLRPVRIDELGTEWVTASFHEHQKTGANSLEFKSDGKQYLGSFSNIGSAFGKEWKIGVVVPKEDFLGPLTRMRRVVVGITIIILIIAVLIAKIIAKGVSKPIIALSEEAKRIENFDLDSETTIRSSIREIQLMSNSITSMKQGLKAFKKYVPSTLVRQLIRTGQEAHLGGKKVELTILFTDIQGFTNISEKVSPEDLMVQLFEYNNALTHIITDMGGTIDKYIGDAIMAFWGAPVQNENHAVSACTAAWRCQQTLSELNAKWGAEGKPLFITRFGLHSGQTIVGNMGSDERMNYSVLGDSVNLASRVEGINKIYGTHVIATQATCEKVSEHFIFRPLDLVAVVGKEQAVMIYELMGKKGEPLPAESLELCNTFTKGFKAYLGQRWDEALVVFTAIQKKLLPDKATELYIQRCWEFKETPPPQPWDGVFRPKKK
ncbi:MAG: hypothetical protein B6245_16540 [Desulfobacteraceae bacterium 4572_88]|nr:MAG: hypothetical protein B6245_16540 [Desulfobacteraceae bacterium 4572_88]